MMLRYGMSNYRIANRLVENQPNEVDILHSVCDAGGVRGGVIRLTELCKRESFTSDEAAKSFLQRFPQFFRLERIQGSDFKVHAHTSAEVCNEYVPDDDDCFDPQCTKFHLCKHFVTGSCKFGQRCKSSHRLMSEHNKEVLEINQIDELDYKTILRLLKLSCVELTVPDTCSFYNTRGCNKGSKCPFLHVCLHYIKGDCRFTNANKQGCRLSHNILDAQPRQVLQKYGINVDQKPLALVHMVRYKKRCEEGEGVSDDQDDVYGTREDEDELGKTASATSQGSSPAQLQRQSSTSPADDSICVFHLGGQCNYGEKCFNIHADEPFQWQYKVADKWESFQQHVSLNIEQAFCNVTKNSTQLNIRNADQPGIVNLKTFQLEYKVKKVPTTLEVRRIAPRFENQGWRKSYATTWLWYWWDDNSYVEYGETSKKGTQASINSATMEEEYRKYQSGDLPQGRLTFKTSKHLYEINFATMKQKNLSLGKVRRLKRRPQFVCKKDVNDRAKRYKDMPSAVAVPDTWDLDAVSEQSLWSESGTDNYSFQLCVVSRRSEEYRDVARKFNTTMSSAHIVSIKRMQNMDLWDDFSRKRMKMGKKNGGKEVREESLFHGTTVAVVPVICQQNFDHRLSGTRVGARYGQGSYFHKNAKYSDRYASPDSKNQKRMFLARVLVGSFTKGSTELRRPPPKDRRNPLGDLHDTCVDDAIVPSIFVTFENNQVYPEYIITYISL